MRSAMMTSACIKHQRDIHALVPGHVSDIKGIYMPWLQGMYQTSKGNTCPPLSVRCCSVYTVTTGTFDPPTNRDITLNKVHFNCIQNLYVLQHQLLPVSMSDTVTNWHCKHTISTADQILQAHATADQILEAIGNADQILEAIGNADQILEAICTADQIHTESTQYCRPEK